VLVPLLIAEGDDGVDAHGAARGDVAGDERNAAEQHRHADEGERVVGADAVN